jgi:hypothetical protein
MAMLRDCHASRLFEAETSLRVRRRHEDSRNEIRHKDEFFYLDLIAVYFPALKHSKLLHLQGFCRADSHFSIAAGMFRCSGRCFVLFGLGTEC